MERIIALTRSPGIRFSSLLYHLHIQAMRTMSHHLGPGRPRRFAQTI